MRDDIETWAPDFEDVRVGTVIFVEQGHNRVFFWSDPDIHRRMAAGDLMRVVALNGRPRMARVEHLRLAEQFHIRVDRLLEWHDYEIVTILPG